MGPFQHPRLITSTFNRQARALLVYACVLVVVRAAKAAVATVSYLVPADPAQTIWKVLFHHQRAAELLC